MNGRICCSRTYQTNQTDRNDKQIKRATFYGQPATKSLNKKNSSRSEVSGKHMYGNRYFIQVYI